MAKSTAKRSNRYLLQAVFKRRSFGIKSDPGVTLTTEEMIADVERFLQDMKAEAAAEARADKPDTSPATQTTPQAPPQPNVRDNVRDASELADMAPPAKGKPR